MEVANKKIKKILRKMIDNYCGWYEMFPYTLLGCQTTVRTSITATPNLLVYGAEARMIRAFHKRVRAWIFEIGQLVLKIIFPHQEEFKGKFAPNLKGPYMVRKVLSGGALVLLEMDGTAWPERINSDGVKRYYM
ncbi:uncharacterized protein LOC107025098 [Solanum pennellii]|uniref:Uncharacterized protein LOC107025098 n=1 Tax=Solanum pennellii TaxID=28526 RepID=A0ABM1H7E0_SOLPN|nr:uncharacterized protein LOC107025098 [Solanum pennellii]